ncbi:DNA-3-methyladenine glycosylase 2 family protein [Chelativorans sp. M5D2P16]|uniref:DNA-3-methyladenine glycosylase family protein n=1 Tax=Chelativorans sp. M5D2P16 TaxID=3095678 RepID=UPI002ACAD4C5|nr:DNA-3-methyladenine glycosylase 2 family protein [Chelativorans sp. M5D2P16]MDZ5699901.1 DNA-3-methyladenine glycosylase 2 family protein [Chelativorans sp. M5D2P16]
MQRIDTVEDLARGLDALVVIDPRLGAVRAAAGPVPLRRSAPGFDSLVSVIVSQQVSRASADAIFKRLSARIDPLLPTSLAAAGIATLIEVGLSRAKQRALAALCRAIEAGSLDLDRLGQLPADDAVAAMTAVPGIGPWTAQVYLLVAAGHADIFPAGDVALRSAVAHAFELDSRPDIKGLAAMAESWSPWRSAAARLFWAYYREMKGLEAAPAA